QALLSVAVLASLVALGGCQANKLQSQRDKLWNQNLALQKKADHLQRALDASEQSRQSLQQRVSTLKGKLAKANSHPAPPVNTGFDKISDVKTTQSPGKITV